MVERAGRLEHLQAEVDILVTCMLNKGKGYSLVKSDTDSSRMAIHMRHNKTIVHHLDEQGYLLKGGRRVDSPTRTPSLRRLDRWVKEKTGIGLGPLALVSALTVAAGGVPVAGQYAVGYLSSNLPSPELPTYQTPAGPAKDFSGELHLKH